MATRSSRNVAVPAARTPSRSPRGSLTGSEDVDPPILEAPSRPPHPPLRPSLASSSGGLSSRSNGSQRFGSVRHPAHALLRRSQAQDSDPCMLDMSFEGWSDGEDETKEDDAQPLRPSIQRSHTEKTGGLAPLQNDAKLSSVDGVGATESVAPLFIRIRKFASTSSLEIRANSVPLSQPPVEPVDAPEQVSNTSFVPANALLEASHSTMEEGFDIADSTRFDEENLHQQPTNAPANAPRVSRSDSVGRWWTSWKAGPRFRRWYGRILNSYFAFWLVVCSLVVALIVVMLLIVLVWMRGSKKPVDRVVKIHNEDTHCYPLTRGRLELIHYTGAVACVLLALPVLLPIEPFELYKKRADRRMIRRPYLHLCELLVTAEVVYLIYVAITQSAVVSQTIKCFSKDSLAESTFVYATVLLWTVLWWQLVVFCRFLVHLKLQADAANDATHTSALSDWLKPERGRGGGLQTKNQMHHGVKDFKKLLFRAAARGDADEVDRLLADPSEYGITGDAGVLTLYAKPPTLWLYAFAASNKNPLHIAAKRGHVAIVQRLLAAGFDANALDKVARVNFNLGLLFKTATRWLVKTQDGFRSPLRSLLCSVLLPPLHGAVAAGHVDVVRLLLEQGHADPNLLPRASFYYPSATIPAIFLADDPEIVKLLVDKGANFLHVATTNLSGLASRTYATPLQRTALTLRSATTEYLLSCGADVALTPLHEAAAADNVKTVRRLLRRRPDLTSSSVDTLGERVEGVQRRTPLHWAAVVGREATATILLERGADPNARDRYGRTPLHWAARNNHATVVTLLLSHGADATAEDDSGVPVLSFAAEAEGVDTQVVAALVNSGASLKHQLCGSLDTPLHIALERENRETATALIRCGADLMVTNSAGKRAVDVTTSTKLQFELKKEAGMRDVMISYPHSHFAFAKRVRETLEAQGKLTCWMDTMDPSGIGGGAVWREEIARGIHNCSVVVSVVCGGYTKSEWCLKELAFAKMIRKPVIALMVEPMDGDDELLDALVPRSHRIPFYDFITAKVAPTPGGVDFEVDDAKLQVAWNALLPQLKDAMRKDASARRHLKSDSGSRMYSYSESEPEVEDDEEPKAEDSDPIVVDAAAQKRVEMPIAVFSNMQQSPLRDRLARDLSTRGFVSRVLSCADVDANHETLTQCRVLVVVLESQGADATREQRQEASEQLSTLLQTAARLHVRVFPIVSRREFLSFSNLYTLARSELLYFVSGLGDKQSMDALMKQLKAAADCDRRR